MKYMSLLVFFLVLSMPVWAIDPSEADPPSIYQYEEYTVQNGDTLWDIATERLEDPFSWPKVWQVNLKIANADLIYPGQVIRIPIELLKPKYRKLVKASAPPVPAPVPVVEPPPEIPVSAPLPAQKPVDVSNAKYLADPNLIASAGFISDDLPKADSIVGSPSDHQLFGKGDTVYVTVRDATEGKKFSIYRKIRQVKHPVTEQPVGILYEVLGSLDITASRQDESTAIITSSYNYIGMNSLLGEYYELEAILVSEKPRTPNVSGYVIATKELRGIVGEYEIVYLDRGANDGLAVGDLLSITRPDKQLHGETIGKIQVIKTMPSTTTAIILKSVQEVNPGDIFGLLNQ